jgi:hypothetical protein
MERPGPSEIDGKAARVAVTEPGSEGIDYERSEAADEESDSVIAWRRSHDILGPWQLPSFHSAK